MVGQAGRPPDRRLRLLRPSGARRRAHASRLGRRPRTGDRPPARGRELRRDRRGGRRHPRDRPRHARGLRRAAPDAPRDAAPADARPRHDDRRGQVGIRAHRRGRAPRAFSSHRGGGHPAGPSPCRAHASRRPRNPSGAPGAPRGMGSRDRRGDRSRGRRRKRSTATSSATRESSRSTRRGRSSRRPESAGMGIRIHADELAHSGGALLAAELSAASADHLSAIGDQEVAALAQSGTVGGPSSRHRLVDAVPSARRRAPSSRRAFPSPSRRTPIRAPATRSRSPPSRRTPASIRAFPSKRRSRR